MKNLMKKLKNKEGFTLAELLIVVAIIAVLVAISIPIFSSKLESSREAVDAANIRSAYAEIMADALTNEDMTDLSKYTVELKQTKEKWQTEFDFPENLIEGTTEPNDGGSATFTWDSTNNQLKTNLKLSK